MVCCMFRCCGHMPSVVCMKIPVCWDVMQFRLMYRYQHFRGVCCFHLQGGPRTNCLTVKTEATSVSEMLELVYRHTPIYEVISYTLLDIWNFFVVIFISTSFVVNVCFLCLRWLITYNIYGCYIVYGMYVCMYVCMYVHIYISMGVLVSLYTPSYSRRLVSSSTPPWESQTLDTVTSLFN